jgi:hypothetical protein
MKPVAGAANDADQLAFLRGEEQNATAAGGNYGAGYTDSQGRTHHINSPQPNTQNAANGGVPPGGDFNSLMASFGGGGGNVAKMPAMPRAPRARLDRAAIDAGDAAAYSRAKDQVGDSTGGLMKALGNQFSSRGLRGSSIEGQAMGSGLEAGMGELADVSRGQAIQNSDRSLDIAKTNYGGDITQRGQDIGQNVASRGQDMDAQKSRMASILGLWNARNSAQRY